MRARWVHPLPERVRGESHAASVYVGELAEAILFFGFGLVSAFTSGGRNWGNGVAPALLLSAVPCAVMARAVATGRIRTSRALDRAALVGLALLSATSYQRLYVSAGLEAGPLTAQTCLVVVMSGLVLRSRSGLVVAWALFLVPWLAVVSTSHVAGFDTGTWISTWVLALSLSVAAYLITATERLVSRGLLGTVRSAAHRDVLTGLANRAGFQDQAARLLALARRRHGGVWCAFVDVDGFKRVNDVLGHETGDAVLVAVARALVRVGRETDLPARWGGDEFIVIGPGPGPDPLMLETRLRDRLSRLPAEVLAVWPATVTVGLAAAADADAVELSALVQRADQAMYERRRDLGRAAR